MSKEPDKEASKVAPCGESVIAKGFSWDGVERAARQLLNRHKAECPACQRIAAEDD